MTDIKFKVLVLHSNIWNHLNVCKQMSSCSYKNVIYKLFINKLYMRILHYLTSEGWYATSYQKFNCVQIKIL